MIVRGRLEEDSAGAVRQGQTGDCLIKPAGMRHANRFGPEPVRTIQIEIADTGGEVGRLLARSTPPPIRGGDAGFASAMIGLYRALLGSPQVEALDALVLDALGSATNLLTRADLRRPAWLVRVEGILRETLQRPPSVAALASEANVHPVHMARVFRRAHGCSIPGYIRRLRVHQAARLASRTRDPLAQIAVDCGFYDQPHLTRDFRRELGVTPQEYRRLAD